MNAHFFVFFRSERSGPSLVVSKVQNSNSKRTGISKVRISLSQRTMIFEGPKLPLAAGHDIRRFGLSFAADHKGTLIRSEPEYFEGLDLPIRSRPGYFEVFSWNPILRQTRFAAFGYLLD
ncbi:hypothetical protein RCL_jg17043.t1 [Rhizophagus clarus]|uniref:Uncharacterized protein n=1 Tax=Rhizophagus clarus TaxID=94130 RepID=A0A8H3LPP9_9GLOM|nr:hypothetical protein RCL_jg17043.t1 [Rhizophagus clarus]